MSTPTPEEIRGAIELLLSVPGVTDGHCLEDIVEISSPLVQMTTELIDMFRRNGVPDLGRLASMIEDTAKRHGLRITADPTPGELVGYVVTENKHTEVTQYSTYGTTELDAARARAAKSYGTAVAALHVLPEGGQA